jgi:hypothetical protein
MSEYAFPFVNPEIRSGFAVDDALNHVIPPLSEYSYPEIVAPPFDATEYVNRA